MGIEISANERVFVEFETLPTALVNGDVIEVERLLRLGLPADSELFGCSLSEWSVLLDCPDILSLLRVHGATPFSKERQDELQKERSKGVAKFKEALI